MDINTKIKDLSETTLTIAVLKYVTDAIELQGSNISEETALKLNRAVIDIIKSRYPWFTLDEVKKSFLRGQAGEFGDYYGINIQSIGKWLKSYNEKVRMPQMKAHFGSAAGQYSDGLTPEEKEKATYEGILKDLKHKFNEYLNDNHDFNNLFTNNAFYNTLDYFGVLRFSAEKKTEVLNKQIQKVKEIEKGKGNRTADFKDFMKDAIPESEYYKEAILRSKSILFKQYVKDCKEMEIDII